ncbi:hypothetical protein [Anaeromicropila herbilytica]|uniref:Uncharacterized protein n=1 Tax=Anaeromicropila herbilytica TaxID=2785025 RepID=A0A7R7EN45_9FIRM|nr:hypothetical protein [Anaeromicropila herbilytica]BCN31842.1 hypothetical protein bsdtb5_31370 [Anaeromicropila herbilytica]
MALFLNNQDSLAQKLEDSLNRPFIYMRQRDIELGNYSVVLINFNNIDECNDQIGLNKLINAALALGKPLILLNVKDGSILSKILGIGFRGRCIIVRPYSTYNVFNALGLTGEVMQETGQAVVTQNEDGSRCFSVDETPCNECPPMECQAFFENLCVAEQVRMIEGILDSEFKVPEELCPMPGSSPADLPESQFKLNYLAIEGKWNLSDQQVTNNSVVMEISLIASFNPKYKYLRIRSVGAGFNPANGADMQYNSTYDRGYFQSHVNIHMQPNSSKLRTLSTEPKNVNKQAQYTTSSEFSVGVDLSKNPTFSSSYTISETMTTTVSDFNIYNNGAGVTADWDFDLSLTENSIWDIFDEEFLKKAKVKELPALATRNLQAVTEAVWYADNTVNDVIGVQLYWEVDHFHCYVTGDWASYTEHYTHKWKTVGYQSTPVNIDFGSVNA